MTCRRGKQSINTTQRWLKASVFEATVQDLRVVLWLAAGRAAHPSAGSDGAQRQRGSKVHMAVDTLGHLLAWHVTAANAQERAQVEGG
jgi:hypothetical protein